MFNLSIFNSIISSSPSILASKTWLIFKVRNRQYNFEIYFIFETILHLSRLLNNTKVGNLEHLQPTISYLTLWEEGCNLINVFFQLIPSYWTILSNYHSDYLFFYLLKISLSQSIFNILLSLSYFSEFC